MTLSGANFPSSAQVRFGTQNPVSATGVSNSQLQVSSPPSASTGSINLTAYFANGWLGLAPLGFSYGPSIAQVLPNTGSQSGGSVVYLYGYGFGGDASKVAVSIAGQTSTVQKVDGLPASSGGLAVDSSYPFPLERITLSTPAGSPGTADISVTTPSGSTTLSRSFQFLASPQNYANPGLYKFILYDASRQQVFLTATDHVAVPGLTLHPTGALVYEPFLDGPPPSAPPAMGIHGGIDIRDAHNGRLRLRVILPEPFAMLSTDVDGLHGNFLTSDEFGQRLFAVTTSGLTIVQLANVPLAIGSLAPASGAAAGGASVTIRGSGFQPATKAALGGKQVSVNFKDMNTLSIVTPALLPGPQQLVLINPDGESVALDAAFFAQ